MAINIQPCASRVAQENYNKTIGTNPSLTLNSIKKYLTQNDINILDQIYGTNQIQVWGIKKGNESKWREIKKGDIVLFSKNKLIFASAVVCHKCINNLVAKELWGTDEDSTTWEYLYFVTDLKNINIPYERFNQIVGYKANYNYMSFQHLDEGKSNKFLDVYPLASDTFMEDVATDEYYDAIKDPFAKDISLDKKTVGTSRKEQSFLRKNLFHNKLFDRCAICGKEFPIGFLWASHIKPRYECTIEEKKDYRNIVVPMCKFGCDDLYEKGYLSVTKGKVVVLKKTNCEEIDNHLKSLDGRKCDYYNEKNQQYFESHYLRNNNTKI